jgi:hypothetical protein
MGYNQKAPPAAAPRGGDFVSFAPFTEDGPAILTIVAFNFIKGHTFTKQDGSTEIADALEFYYGANTDEGPRFIKTWPSKYSIHEKANYAKLYKACTGALPVAGSNPADLLGKGVQAILENEDKVSKKGKAYTKTSVKSVSMVKDKLRGDITPLAKLLPALEAEFAKAQAAQNSDGKPAGGAKPPLDEDVPF